jgi:broad specificity phosphatase PhoE
MMRIRETLQQKLDNFDAFAFHVYYSPFSRTTETAEAIAKAFGLEINDGNFHVRA